MELSRTDRNILVSALQVYRVNRAATGKLESQKLLRTDRAAATALQARYDVLVAHCERLIRALS